MKVRVGLVVGVLLGFAQLGCGAKDEAEKGRIIDTNPIGEVPGGGADASTPVGEPPGTGTGTPGGEPPDGEPCDGSCGPDEVCNTATDSCEPKPAVCDCDPGSYCDSATNTCVAGCKADSDCATGQTCDVAANTCVTKPTCEGTLVPGLSLTKVVINQAVEVPLFDKGAAVATSARPSPVIQNRPALFRVSVTPGTGYVPTEVIAQLTLENAGVATTLEAKQMVTAASKESTLDGTLNIKVDDAKLIGPDTKFSIALTQTGCVATQGTGRYPSTGTAALEATKTGRFKVVVVPYQRAPFTLNTAPERIQALKDAFFAFYPTEGVDLEMHAPVAVTNASTDLQRILQHIRGLRAEDSPSDDTYYFGLFTAANTFREFCGDGCVAGIATLGGNGQFGSPADRYGVGIGYLSDIETTSMGMPTTEQEITTNVMVHELGHSQGRQHTPCGDPAGIDRNFPNKTAAIDTYGYNLVNGAFATPEKHKDVMAYCEPQWIHPYTYSAISKRIAGVNQGLFRIPGPAIEYTSVLVQDDGRRVWGDKLTLTTPPSGMVVTTEAYDAAGSVVDSNVQLTFTELADFEGVLVTLPAPKPSWASIKIDGQRVAIPASTNL